VDAGPTFSIFAQHGEADPLVPIERTRESVERLKALGVSVELRTYPGVSHAVTPVMHREVLARIAHALGG
jgi:predicted esterase